MRPTVRANSVIRMTVAPLRSLRRVVRCEVLRTSGSPKPFGTAPFPVWRAFLGSFAALERVLGPNFRRLIRFQGDALVALDLYAETCGVVDASVPTAMRAMPGD